eukprot:1978195-Heterocapsa_arctica.AAC.1
MHTSPGSSCASPSAHPPCGGNGRQCRAGATAPRKGVLLGGHSGEHEVLIRAAMKMKIEDEVA